MKVSFNAVGFLFEVIKANLISAVLAAVIPAFEPWHVLIVFFVLFVAQAKITTKVDADHAFDGVAGD